jgi:hypothetical protein
MRYAADFSGQVVSVLNGDTIEVLHINPGTHLSLFETPSRFFQVPNCSA